MTIKKDSIISFFLASAVLGVSISYSAVYLFHIALFLLLTFYSLIIMKNNFVITKYKPPTNLHKFFYWMFLWYCLTIVWSIDKALSFQYIFYIFCGSMVALTIIYYAVNVEKQNKVFKILAIFFIIEVALSLLEAFTPFRLPISRYSNYVEYFGREREVFGSESATLPATGFQWNPNTLATTLNIIFPFFLLHPKRPIKFLGSISIITLIFLSESRGNIVALILILLVYIYFFNNRRTMIVGTLLPAMAISIFILFYPIINTSNNVILNQIEYSFETLKVFLTSDQQTNDSIGTRRLLIENGLAELKKSYGIGVGGGASQVVISKNIPWLPEKFPMHNFWIEILVEGGVIFFVTFAIWYVRVLCKLFIISRSKDKRIKYYAMSSFLSMVGFIIGAVSASSTIYVLPMWLMFGFAIATINNYKLMQQQI